MGTRCTSHDTPFTIHTLVTRGSTDRNDTKRDGTPAFAFVMSACAPSVSLSTDTSEVPAQSTAVATQTPTHTSVSHKNSHKFAKAPGSGQRLCIAGELVGSPHFSRKDRGRRASSGKNRESEGRMSRRITFLGVVRFTDRVLVAGYSPSEADDSLIIKEVNTAIVQRKTSSVSHKPNSEVSNGILTTSALVFPRHTRPPLLGNRHP